MNSGLLLKKKVPPGFLQKLSLNSQFIICPYEYDAEIDALSKFHS